MRAETKETPAPVSIISMHQEPSSEAAARVWTERKCGGGSRGVGSTSSPLSLDRGWVSSASRLTTITLSASRVNPSTRDLPGLLVACIAAGGRASRLPPSSAAIAADKKPTSVSPFVDALPRWLGATGSGRGC